MSARLDTAIELIKLFDQEKSRGMRPCIFSAISTINGENRENFSPNQKKPFQYLITSSKSETES